MTALWTAAEAAQATGGKTTGDWQASGVSIDTRSLQKGDLFVALSATRDGHDFVADALAKGAAAALVSRIPEGLEDAPLLLVSDVLQGLVALGIAARVRCNAKVVAITGSVGKTGSKEMLRCALLGQGKLHVAEKSYNNHEGVPLTLARMPRDTEIAVIEIGMNHPGEIVPLTRMARPHIVMVTTVAPVHLEAFANVREIAAEKASICEGLEPDGVAVLNADIDDFDVLGDAASAAGARIIRFGADAKAEFQLEQVEISAGVTVVRAATGTSNILFKLTTPARHLAMNALGVLAVVEALGADPARAVLGLGAWQPPQGRGASYRVALGPAGIDGSFTLIDESYNANPASVGAALDVLANSHTRGKRIAILGDMLELGEGSADLHMGLAAVPSIKSIDKIHCVGPMMALLHCRIPPDKSGLMLPDTARLAPLVGRQIADGDVVMVKGSLGMKMAKIVDAIKNMGDATPLSPTNESL